MEEKNFLTKFSDIYENNPIIRALITATTSIPIAGSILDPLDEAVLAQIQNMRQKRFATFFEELAQGEHELTEKLIQDHDFLHAYFSTLKAAVNSRREEKIRLFAHLLINSTRDKFYKTDEFEEFVDILDSLSMREFNILITLKTFEDSEPSKKREAIKEYWNTFKEKLKETEDINDETFLNSLARLNRTGLFDSFYGFFGGRTEQGKVTPLFDKFIEKLMDDYHPEP